MSAVSLVECLTPSARRISASRLVMGRDIAIFRNTDTEYRTACVTWSVRGRRGAVFVCVKVRTTRTSLSSWMMRSTERPSVNGPLNPSGLNSATCEYCLPRNGQATGYESQHIWCLSQARINWEGCARKGIRRKNGGDGRGGSTN